MKTPIEVGRYRFKIIKNMLAVVLTLAQAENMQQMADREIMRLICANNNLKGE